MTLVDGLSKEAATLLIFFRSGEKGKAELNEGIVVGVLENRRRRFSYEQTGVEVLQRLWSI